MSRDYKATQRPAAPAKKKGSGGMGKVLIGILIGLIAGVGIALGVVMYFGKPGHPKTRDDVAKVEPDKTSKASKNETDKPVEKLTPETKQPEKSDKAAKSDKSDKSEKKDNVAKSEDKPRFDFYKILNGDEPQKPAKKEEPKAESKEKPEKATEKPKAVSTEPKEPAETKKEAKNEAKNDGTYFLQVASLTNQTDADELKARLSLLGMQARVVAVSLPEKGMRYRVRVGPYGGINEVERAREDLRKNNFQADLIKHKEGN